MAKGPSVKVTTERLTLREFLAADVDVMHSWQSDPRYLEHYPEDSAQSPSTGDLIELFLSWQQEKPRWRWQLAIALRATGELIGSCGVRRENVDALAADIGYELNPDHWGQGYATEAVGRLVAFAFDEVGITELTARVVDTNERSLRVLERLGFSAPLALSAGAGKDGRMWPPRTEYRHDTQLERMEWMRKR